jgi:hypothetical protein
MTFNCQGKIVILWVVFLLGILFHTELGLMPLFHGVSVASEPPDDLNLILWLMLGFFVLPMLAIVGTAFTAIQQYRIAHFGLTLIYSFLNFLHLMMDLRVQPIVWAQIALMGILFVVGLLLNWVSFQWLQERKQGQKQRQEIYH